MNYLVTGAAGFIGFHVSLRLLKAGYRVTGVDNLNDYYDVQLKKTASGCWKLIRISPFSIPILLIVQQWSNYLAASGLTG